MSCFETVAAGQDKRILLRAHAGSDVAGTQDDPLRMPIAGELQLTDIASALHLLVSGEKMSKRRGNFYGGDQGLSEKQSDFDFGTASRATEPVQLDPAVRPVLARVRSWFRWRSIRLDTGLLASNR